MTTLIEREANELLRGIRLERTVRNMIPKSAAKDALRGPPPKGLVRNLEKLTGMVKERERALGGNGVSEAPIARWPTGGEWAVAVVVTLLVYVMVGFTVWLGIRAADAVFNKIAKMVKSGEKN